MKRFASILLCLTVFAFTAIAANPGATAYTNPALTNAPVLAYTGPAILSGQDICNQSNGVVFIQFFDASSTSGISLGTTPPLFWISVPINGGQYGASSLPGVTFVNGVVIAATTTPNGALAPSAGTPTVLMLY